MQYFNKKQSNPQRYLDAISLWGAALFRVR